MHCISIRCPWRCQTASFFLFSLNSPPQHPLRTQASPYPALMPLYIRSSHSNFSPEWQWGGRIEDDRTSRGGQWERLVSLLPRLTEKGTVYVCACLAERLAKITSLITSNSKHMTLHPYMHQHTTANPLDIQKYWTINCFYSAHSSQFNICVVPF